MRILGLSVFCDASAVLIENDNLICAVEEERLNRIKHYEGFPWLAMHECLDIADINFGQVDFISIGWNPLIGWLNRICNSCKSLLNSRRAFLFKLGRGTGYSKRCRDLIFLKAVFKRRFHAKRINQKFVFVDHHLAHAASAFLMSPWEDANTIVADGLGESATISFYNCTGPTIKKLKTIEFPHSLGHVYASVTKFLGFKMCYDEGKVMALAAYGRNTFTDLFSHLIEMNLNKGTIKVKDSVLDYHLARYGVFSKQWLKLTCMTPRQNHESITQKHKDLACSLQKRIEDAIITLINKNIPDNNVPLCAAGGLFLNSVMNGRILREVNNQFFVQPAAGDNGVSLGAALYVASKNSLDFNKSPLKTIVQGRAFPDTVLSKILKDLPNKYYYSHNVCLDAAEHIVQGKVVGWFQGGMEFGPRALGNRSILANPLRQHTKELVNTKVKHRENFRPFAGSVLSEEGNKYFKNYQESPFMSKVFFFKDEYKHKFPAIVHIDHSCRIQTVSKVNGLYYELLREVKKKTGYGVVLNTSLNTKGQPIVNTPSEALTLLNSTDLDILVLGPYIVYKL